MKKLLTIIGTSLLVCYALIVSSDYAYAYDSYGPYGPYDSAEEMERQTADESISIAWRFLDEDVWHTEKFTAKVGEKVEVMAYYTNLDSDPHAILGASINVPSGFVLDTDNGVSLMGNIEVSDDFSWGIYTLDADTTFKDLRAIECENLIVQPSESAGFACQYEIVEPEPNLIKHFTRSIEVGAIYANFVIDANAEENVHGRYIMADVIPSDKMVKSVMQTVGISLAIIGVGLTCLIVGIVLVVKRQPTK